MYECKCDCSKETNWDYVVKEDRNTNMFLTYNESLPYIYKKYQLGLELTDFEKDLLVASVDFSIQRIFYFDDVVGYMLIDEIETGKPHDLHTKCVNTYDEAFELLKESNIFTECARLHYGKI